MHRAVQAVATVPLPFFAPGLGPPPPHLHRNCALRVALPLRRSPLRLTGLLGDARKLPTHSRMSVRHRRMAALAEKKLAQFWAAHQRFFRSLLTAYKLPTCAAGCWQMRVCLPRCECTGERFWVARDGSVWLGRVGLSHRSGRPFRKASRSSRLILPPSLSATNPHDPATAPHRPHAALVVAVASRSAPFVMFRTCE